MTVGDFWRSMRNAVVQVSGRPRKPRRPRDGRRASLFAEVLEQRELLSVNQIVFDSATGQLNIGGTPNAEQIVVSMDSPSVVRVRAQSIDGIVERTFQRSAVSSLYYYGGEGDDQFSNVTNIPSLALGEGGNDYLSGGSGADDFRGGEGNDVLEGKVGNDTLIGEEGNDSLMGGDGNDKLYSGSGDDTLDGGAGDDALDGGENDDQLLGSGGNDQLLGGLGNDELRGGDGDDRLDGNDGDDFLDAGNGSDALFGGDGIDQLYGGDGDDKLFAGVGNDLLDGGAGIDELAGGLGDDQLFGGIGNDNLRGDEGNDRLRGDDGDDSLDGGIGDDVLEGNNGLDLLVGSDGVDHLYGGEHDDKLYGGAGNDILEGGGGNDDLGGGLGDDYLTGSFGNDSLRGEVGNDYLRGDDGDDRLDGSDGDDLLDAGNGNDTLFGGEGIDQLYGSNGDDKLFSGGGNDLLDGGAGGDELGGGLGDDQLFGGIGNDNLRGDEGNDRLRGDDGDDSLDGGIGDDVLEGNNGLDLLVGSDGVDRLYGGEHDDNLYGGTGNDILEGGGGNDEGGAGSGDDTVSGGAGHDTMRGDAGNDLLLGGDGDDILYGDDGSDRIEGEAGYDSLFGGAGQDTLSGGLDDDSLFGEADNDRIEGGAGNDNLHGSTGNDQLFGGDGDDSIYGLDGIDRLDGEAGDDFLQGGAGNDTLMGGADDDQLLGDEGDDWANGMAGNDRIIGGAGNDTLMGADGDDVMEGSAGRDTVLGQAGNDVLNGMEGDDVLFGGDGNDRLNGGQGQDWLNGEAGNDNLVGAAEADYVSGGAGDDQLSVETGQHALVGGAGNDKLTGGIGNDLLIGGEGVDQLNGFNGDDLLIGGTTSFDQDYRAIRNLLAVWQGAGTYVSKIAQFENELAASRLISNDTVQDDGVADAIFGGGGQDWLFLTGYMAIYDPNNAFADPTESAGGGHSHAGPIVVNQPPALEGFDFVDSLDKIGDRAANESLHTLIPHTDDSSLQREHLTLNQLVRYEQVTHYAVASGAWSNPNTWSGGVVPGNGARVLVPIGVNVTVDRVLTTRINTIRVDGTLSFSTATSSELRVDTIVVTNVGRFEMGSPAAPIPAHVSARLVFTDNGPIDRVADPFGISRGLISHGSVSIYGAAVTSRVPINGSALAGSSVLTLKTVPSGWKIGDSIVVASSVLGSAQNESRRILAIFGNRITLDRALSFNHVPYSAAMEIHVANMTRNLQITSESSAAERRGHVMFMHNDDVHVANAGFYQLGRTNKEIPINDPVVNADWQLAAGTGTNPRARYPVHFHRTGVTDDGNPATVAGSVVVDSPGWGFVNHSSNVDMFDNVAYAVHGAAFVTEVGDETGSFVGNIAVGTTGSGEDTESRLNIQDFGHQGDGFWFQGPGIRVMNNVSAGNDGSAFFLFARGLVVGGKRGQFLAENLPDPSIANGATAVSIESVPIFKFDQNVGYASVIGLSVWYHLGQALGDTQGEFTNSRFFNNFYGIDLPYTQNTTLRNMTVAQVPIGAPGESWGRGVNSNLVTRDIVYENLTVQGYYQGIWLPRQGSATVVGGNYSNYFDFFINTAIKSDRVVYITGPVQMQKLIMDPYFTYPDGYTSYIFETDRVILNFGPYQNQRVYYEIQAANAIPFPKQIAALPPSYVGRTSQQLWNQFGVAVGGTLAPANVTLDPRIIGLLGPRA